MTITIKGVPPSLNRYLGKENGAAYREAKAQWTRAVFFTVRASKERPAQPFQKADVHILYYFPDRRRRDPDNYCGKLLLDGLVKARAIADDSMQHIRLHIAGDCDSRNPRTVITITEVKE